MTSVTMLEAPPTDQVSRPGTVSVVQEPSPVPSNKRRSRRIISTRLSLFLEDKSLNQQFKDGLQQIEAGYLGPPTPSCYSQDGDLNEKDFEKMDPVQNQYQRDWDHEAKGNFELAILEGQRRSIIRNAYPDEKAMSMISNSEQDDEELEYPSTTRLLLLSFGLAMITFTVTLDNTIIATAIPKITAAFNALDDVGWYGSAYLLTTTALQPTFGKVYQYFDVKWTYLSALVIFELGSVICAAATSSLMLIVGRAVAGIGAAALFSGSMTILGYSVPLEKRAIYLGAMSSMLGIASVIGPILGGALTDKLSWRWCFWINLPFGGVSIISIFFFFKNPKLKHASLPLKQKVKEMDVVGATFFVGAIVSLLLALQWGGITYPWSDSKVVGCLVAFGILFVFFLGAQWYLGDSATMPPRVLLGNRTVAASAVFTALYAMAFYTHIYYLAFYFQIVKGSTAEESGIQVVPYLISLTVGSILTGAFITTIGLYCPPLYVGSLLFTIGCGLLYTLDVDTPSAQWIGYQIVTGFGVGCMVQIPFIAMQATLNVHDMPVGNAVAAFFNTFGGAIALAIDQNVFSNTLKQGVYSYATDIPLNVLYLASQASYRQYIPSQYLPEILFVYNYTITTVFIMPIAVALAAFFVGFLIKWKSVKGQNLLAAVG